jgi:hypothetical protein
MTPEERGSDLVSRMLDTGSPANYGSIGVDESVLLAVEAIGLAVLAERERCAKLAEDGAKDDPHNHAYEFGLALAAAIREGKS